MVECDSRCRILWFTLLQIGRNKEVTESNDAHVTTFNLDVGNFSWHTPPVNHYYFPPFETFTRVTHTTIWFNRFLILLCSFSCLHIFIVATKECFAQWVLNAQFVTVWVNAQTGLGLRLERTVCFYEWSPLTCGWCFKA